MKVWHLRVEMEEEHIREIKSYAAKFGLTISVFVSRILIARLANIKLKEEQSARE